MKVLLVTIVIGEDYLNMYNQLFRKSQEEYAKKNGYDFKIVTDYLDKNPRYRVPSTASFNKILTSTQDWSEQYDFIIAVDADILININSPPIHESMIGDSRIGMVDEYSQPSYERRLEIQKKNGWEVGVPEYYNKHSGFVIDTNILTNTGVIVMQPKIHCGILQRIYNTHIEGQLTAINGFHYEQACTGYDLQMRKLIKILDNRFNRIWALQKTDNVENISLDDFFSQNYFLHFAGHNDYDKVEQLYERFLKKLMSTMK